MSNEKPIETAQEAIEVSPEYASMEIIQNTLDDFISVADVNSAYGPPIKEGDTLIIPTAEVLSVMGFGVGSGSGSGPSENGEGKQGYGEGSGGGGGGSVLSRPVAVIIASPEGVRVEPVVDVTKIALAALTTAGFMAGMLFKMRRPR